MDCRYKTVHLCSGTALDLGRPGWRLRTVRINALPHASLRRSADSESGDTSLPACLTVPSQRGGRQIGGILLLLVLVRLRLPTPPLAQSAAASWRRSARGRPPTGGHGQELSHSMVDFAILAARLGVVGAPACGGSSHLRRCRFGSDGRSDSSAEESLLACLVGLGEAAAVGRQDQKIESPV